MGRDDTRQVFRAREQARLSRLLGKLIDDTPGMTRAKLAAECGVSPSLVYRWLDPDDRCMPGAHDIACFPLEIRRSFVAGIAGDDLTVVPAIGASEGLCPKEALHHVVVELNEFQAAYVRAGADGAYDRQELTEIEREGTEAVEVATAIVHWARGQLEALAKVAHLGKRGSR